MNFKSLALAGLVATTALFTGVGSVEARPTRTVCDSTDNGTKFCIEPIGYNSVDVVVTNPYTEKGFIGQMNCSTGTYQWRANTGWSQQGIEDVLEIACGW